LNLFFYKYFSSLTQGYNVNADDLKDTKTASLFYHRLIEAFKFAYAKRSELGDPSKINITDVCTK
jgi:gamma-glutamyltranspeptidase/glutathione hydrolase/leukotriene-C4 hydrolase